ncbi:hypothetical protein KAW50_02690 [candidate division WOR-3 bacterium]|nr:hypothetical protein [candidate division WOR-3 bacterium]
MKSIFHIIQTGITGKAGDFKRTRFGKPWVKERIELFKKYNLNSLLNQEDRNFIHWISWCEADQENEDVIKLGQHLKKIEYPYVFTFKRLPYIDTHGNNRDLKERRERMLPLIKKFYKDQAYVYFTVLDSDDLYRKDAIKIIKQTDPNDKKAMFFQIGYGYNFDSKDLCIWVAKWSPPFFTFIFPSETFWDVDKHSEWIRHYHVHHDVDRIFKGVKLPRDMFIQGIHGGNATTRWTNAYRQRIIIDEDQKAGILKDFGIHYAKE